MDRTLETVLEAFPLPVLLIGTDERVLRINRRAEEILGRGLVGRHYVTALRAPAILSLAESVIAGRADRGETAYLASDTSRETSWRVTAATVALPSGRGTLVSFEDTTALQEAGQIRRDFVANVSHELRTPLTALLGFIETLKGAAKDDPAARARFLDIMEREAGRMNRLVRDLLSLSRVEAEERMRPTQAVDLAGLLRSVVQSLRQVAEESGVTVRTSGLDAGLEIPGEPDQLAQVFTNLLENAVKYSGRGSLVEVSLSKVAHDPLLRGSSVEVTVADNGEGIDPIHIPRLTERFYRVDSHRSREVGGTGLGLAIVKHIVNRHRGRLRIESERGKGSKFTVFLPAA